MLIDPRKAERKNLVARTWTMVALGLAVATSGCTRPRSDGPSHGEKQPTRDTVLAAERQPEQTSVARAEEDEAFKLGVDAYVYGYPLVTMEMTRRVMTNAKAPEETHAPMGQFAHQRRYPDASFREITAPNADTLYSTAWIDVSKEPYILHVPDEPGRYYLMPTLDGWTNVFGAPGTRTTGTKAADVAITGPGWNGTLPKDVKEYRSSTNIVWILGRTYCDGTPADYDAVHAIQNGYSLIPLGSYGKPYTPSSGKVDPNVDMSTPTRDQVNRLTAREYFGTMAALLRKNPPAREDVPMVARLAKIGISPGKDFDAAKLSPAALKGLERAPKAALEAIVASEAKVGTLVNGWLVMPKTGQYGTDYMTRAVVTMVGLGANLPEDAVYPVAKIDGEGRVLSGANRYHLHFDKQDLPPVKGFWSLTMYDEAYFFVDNPLNKYTVSPRNHLEYNADGSLDIYVQHDSPGEGKGANWLPSPKQQFILMLRLYWPGETVIDGRWKPPPAKRL